MSGPKALVFDVDGTLAETEETHRRAFNDTFAAFGLDWHWSQELYGALLKVTGGKERILHHLERHRPDELDRVRPRIPEIHARKTERYAALVEAEEEGDGGGGDGGDGLTLRPGVLRLIAEARSAGLRLAIATTTSRPNVVALLRRVLPLSGETNFEVIAAGDEAARKKPWPDVYDLALARLGLPPEACLAFEDSANGLLAARRAGLPVIITPGVYTAAEDFAGAASVVSDLGEPGRPHRHLAGAAWAGGVVTVAQLRERWAELRGGTADAAGRAPEGEAQATLS